MGQTTQYQYDSENDLAAVVMPAVPNPATGQLVNPTYQYGYDANGNQTRITDPNGGVTTFTFDAQGNELSRTLPLGQTESFQYDDQNRQTLAVSFRRRSSRNPFTIQHRETWRRRFSIPVSSAYDNGNGTPSETITYKHDAFGAKSRWMIRWHYGSAAGVRPHTYDSQGNVLSGHVPSGDRGAMPTTTSGGVEPTMIGPANAPRR